MNEKLFRCVICGEQVSKRQSVAYDGPSQNTLDVIPPDSCKPRACRKHSEAMQAKDERIAAEEKKYREEREQISRMMKKRHPEYKVPQGDGPHCWHCCKEGITSQQHYIRLMIANEVCSQQGTSFLDVKALKQAYGEIKPILVYVRVWEGHDIVRQTRDGDILHNISNGHMFICRDCACKFNILPEWEKALCPEMKPETLKMMMAIGDSLPITKIVKDVASIKIAMENCIIPISQEQKL